MNGAKKSEKLKKLTLHKETLKQVRGGDASTQGVACNTSPSMQGDPQCDDTAACVPTS